MYWAFPAFPNVGKGREDSIGRISLKWCLKCARFLVLLHVSMYDFIHFYLKTLLPFLMIISNIHLCDYIHTEFKGIDSYSKNIHCIGLITAGNVLFQHSKWTSHESCWSIWYLHVTHVVTWYEQILFSVVVRTICTMDIALETVAWLKRASDIDKHLICAVTLHVNLQY